MTELNLRYAVWPTAWGPMGAVRGPRGLIRLMLPHYQLDDLRALLAFEHTGGVEDLSAFADLAPLAQAYFNGQRVSFDAIPCDLPEKTFSGKVLRACRAIPHGQTQTYTWLARAAGNPDGARAAAAALGKNPVPLVVPCHRVTYMGGKLAHHRPVGIVGGLGGFSAPGGPEQKLRMLKLEKAIVV